MNVDELVNLCDKAWSLTALALIHQGVPARVSVLAAAAGTSRSSMTPSVTHLYSLSMLRENPGHGHPLRPEGKLTPQGKRWAVLAAALTDLLHSNEDQQLCRLNWTLPVLCLADEPVRFGQLNAKLGRVTDRALSLTLRKLEEHAWIERVVNAETRPPQVTYSAINDGFEVATLLNQSIS